MKIFPYMVTALAVVLLVSCSKGPDTENTERSKSAGEIIEKYTETLSTAPDKARRTSQAVDERIAREMKALEELD